MVKIIPNREGTFGLPNNTVPPLGLSGVPAGNATFIPLKDIGKPLPQVNEFLVAPEKVQDPNNTPSVVEKPEVSPQDLAATLAKLESGEQFQDNPLNDILNPTYHFRFFTTADRDVVWANVGHYGKKLVDSDKKETSASKLAELMHILDNQLEQVTIAETGVTTYSIQEVIITSLVAPSFTTRATSTTGLKMTIVEPYGVSFPDSLLYATQKLIGRNPAKAWYYLELTFKGYERTGKNEGAYITNALHDKFLNKGRWIWTVSITDMAVSHNNTGTTYVLTMLPVSDTVLESTQRSVPDATIITGDTVGEMLEDLALKVKQAWAVRNGDDGANPIVFNLNFEVHDVPARKLTAQQIKDLTLRTTTENFNPARDRGMDRDSKTGKIKAHIPRGTTIPDAVSLIFSNSEFAQNLAKDSSKQVSSTDDTENEVNSDGFRRCAIPRLEPEVRIPGYDWASNTYYKDIIWHIRFYETQMPILSVSQIKQAQSSEIQDKMLAALAKRNFLSKRYDYQYTGMNTEVKECNIQYNMAWQASIPRLLNYKIENQTQGKLKDSTKNPESDLTKNNKIDPNYNTQIEAARDRYDSDQARLYNDNLTDKERSDIQTDSNRDLADAKYLYDQAKTARIDSERKHKALGDPFDPKHAGKRSYAEDLDATLDAELLKISIGQNFEESRNMIADGMPGQLHAGKTIFGAILAQTYGPIANNLQKLSMTIRGDPYWLGPASFDAAVLACDANAEIDPSTGTAIFGRGDNSFLFHYRYPVRVSEDAEAVLKLSETFSGFYQVSSVTHTFQNGEFTQSVEALRMPLLSFAQALKLQVTKPEVNKK